MPEYLIIGHGNGHNEQSLVRFARESRADSFSAQEAQQLLDEFQKVPRHRVTVAGEGWTEDRNRAKSTLIMTRNNRPNIGEFTRKVSERIPRSLMVAPDRVLVCSMYEHPVARAVKAEGIAHFSLHPDAGPQALQGKNPKHPIVREYREALASTMLYMRAARQDGLVPILTGDLQLRKEHNSQPWSPYSMLAEPLNMEWATAGLDWIIWDKRLARLGPMTQRKLFDHIGFIQNFVPAKRTL